jgi:hypothetical protein
VHSVIKKTSVIQHTSLNALIDHSQNWNKGLLSPQFKLGSDCRNSTSLLYRPTKISEYHIQGPNPIGKTAIGLCLSVWKQQEDENTRRHFHHASGYQCPLENLKNQFSTILIFYM